jgi:hypothetical protein
MAVADTKELAQCLAFAYFAEYPNYPKDDKKLTSEHATMFFELFSRKSSIATLKQKYLSKNFPTEKVKDEFKYTKTQVTKQISYSETAKKVYNVVKECIRKKMFKYSMDEYVFLDQGDDFTIKIKDELMKRALRNFGFANTIKPDTLSSIDVFCVRRSKKTEIINECTKLFGDDVSMINNFVSGTDYAEFIGKHMDSGNLIPVSLKLPSTISGNIHVKEIHDINKRPISENTDPYIKFLATILDNPSKTKNIIDSVIDLKIDDVVSFEKLNWELPVSFNYTKYIDPQTKQKIAEYNLEFNLFAQGYGAGFNGQFAASTKKYKNTQWVGGIGANTFYVMAKKYAKFNEFMRKLSDLRLDCLKSIADKMSKADEEAFKKCSALYANAQKNVKNDMIHSSNKEEIQLLAFFAQFDRLYNNKENFLENYRLSVINAINGKSKILANYTDMKRLKAHYVHAQLFYLFLIGGKNLELYFKQKMFLSIFGLITKMAHIYFDESDYDKMKTIVTTQLNKQREGFFAEFRTAPHFLIS